MLSGPTKCGYLHHSSWSSEYGSVWLALFDNARHLAQRNRKSLGERETKRVRPGIARRQLGH